MKITGIYFSGTGNTEWVAKKLSYELLNKGHETEFYSIEGITVKELTKKFEVSDIIGFMYPGYGCDMPKVYKDYLKGIEEVVLKENTKAFSIVTAGMHIADGALVTKPLCEKIGAELRWANVLLMPCNFDTPVPFFKIPSEKTINKMKIKAARKIGLIAQNIDNGVMSYDGSDFFNTIAGKSQRISSKKSMEKYEVKVNEEKCISCGRCVDICPAHNLSIDEKGVLRTNGNCSVCLRCMNTCSAYALRMFNGKGKKEYRQYKGPGI